MAGEGGESEHNHHCCLTRSASPFFLPYSRRIDSGHACLTYTYFVTYGRGDIQTYLTSPNFFKSISGLFSLFVRSPSSHSLYGKLRHGRCSVWQNLLHVSDVRTRLSSSLFSLSLSLSSAVLGSGRRREAPRLWPQNV